MSTVNLLILRVPELFMGDLLITEVSEGIAKHSNILKKLMYPRNFSSMTLVPIYIIYFTDILFS